MPTSAFQNLRNPSATFRLSRQAAGIQLEKAFLPPYTRHRRAAPYTSRVHIGSQCRRRGTSYKHRPEKLSLEDAVFVRRQWRHCEREAWMRASCSNAPIDGRAHVAGGAAVPRIVGGASRRLIPTLRPPRMLDTCVSEPLVSEAEGITRELARTNSAFSSRDAQISDQCSRWGLSDYGDGRPLRLDGGPAAPWGLPALVLDDHDPSVLCLV
ncbi:hypothetical protein C8Q79DRAFT_310294 [Trametes meyenii]|nr:hypothetical protein C8Q79DRAFT_310294 [Trametes meyenii]